MLDSALDEVNQEKERGDYTDDVNKFGLPGTFVRQIAKEITGRELPDNITFQIRDIDNPEAAGFSRFDQRLVVSKNMNYTMLALVFAHEVGHLMAQHQEDFLGKNPHQRSIQEVSDWEEACAYAFEAVTAAYMAEKYPELRSMATSFELANYLGFLNEYYSGHNAGECHRRGMAIFDAAYTTLGSLAKAYNFLSSNWQLTDKMQNVLDDNQKAHKLNWDDNFQTPGKKAVEARIERITKRLKALEKVTGM